MNQTYRKYKTSKYTHTHTHTHTILNTYKLYTRLTASEKKKPEQFAGRTETNTIWINWFVRAVYTEMQGRNF